MAKLPFSPEEFFSQHRGAAEWIGLRYVKERTSHRLVRNGNPDRNTTSIDEGVMVEVLTDGHFGHAATSDLSPSGLEAALDQALATTKAVGKARAFEFSHEERPLSKGRYESPRQRALGTEPLDKIQGILLACSEAMAISPKIVNRMVSAILVETEIAFLSTSGSDQHQIFDLAHITVHATAAEGSESQTRSRDFTAQAGGEIFDRESMVAESKRVAEQALELLGAENCPSETMDLILMPDQMTLQIHESIGHPLELDRILGDERNYAGWSFVQASDFGNLRYGSSLMNITFDPTVSGEFASYAFDDGGNPATKEFLIENGVLKRGLGSLESQKRSKLKGVANFRASSWNRAPIDRMANINLEAGDSSLEEMIKSVKRGILMQTNRSWSIDDYRNKFQFGCEYGQLIENGKITRTVKNPNYRGVTVSFWNSLAAVGAADTRQVHGTPYCGKGEPNQVIRVGHASSPCLFRDVEVFGGGA